MNTVGVFVSSNYFELKSDGLNTIFDNSYCVQTYLRF